jgi:glycosyltransferase involved in cell wall biosynthesis
MPRILFVAMADSVHTARWISQIVDQGWDLYLFPAKMDSPHMSLHNLTAFGADPLRPRDLDRSVRYKRWSSYYFYRDSVERHITHRSTLLKEIALARVIRSVKPDLIHTLEFQHSAYMTMGAKKLLSTPFPKWIATNWGSDIYLFGRLLNHKPKIQEVLANCDFYSAECQRDVELAWQMGFSGKVLPVLPNGGGYDLQNCSNLRQVGSTSARKVIALKGYNGWAGRALVGLCALKLCVDQLSGYEVVIYSAEDDVRIAAELFEQDTGIKVTILPQSSHEEILKLHGRARISIGLSISDAISTSLLEAMIMGSFPIQSGTACANEWVADGRGGFIVQPEDPYRIADAVRKALSDDTLVNSAAEVNAQTVRPRLDQGAIKAQVIKMYQEILTTL